MQSWNSLLCYKKKKKGEEWVMEDREIITKIWSPEDLVAVCDKGTKLDGKD